MMRIFGLLVLGCLCQVHVLHAQTPTQTPASRIAVAAQDIPRGTVLRVADIRWISPDTGTLSARSDSTSTVASGWVARRRIRAGEVLQPPSVSKPDLVTTGETVDVVYADTGIKLTLKGTAIGDGAKGDEVYVRLETRKRLRATVIDEHTVRIIQ